MADVIVDVPLEALPELLRQAVSTVHGATLIEVRPDGALTGRRSNFAMGSETTRFTFHARTAGGCDVHAEATNNGGFASASVRGSKFVPGALLETGRAVLNALVHVAEEPKS
jgi:hypothetical protein